MLRDIGGGWYKGKEFKMCKDGSKLVLICWGHAAREFFYRVKFQRGVSLMLGSFCESVGATSVRVECRDEILEFSLNDDGEVSPNMEKATV